MSDTTRLPTEEDLEQLSLRGIVAFAARCAKRVQPRYGLAKSIAGFAEHQQALSTAISMAEQFCQVPDINVLTAAAGADTAAYDAADAKIDIASSAAACAAAACEAANTAEDAAPAFDAACAATYAASASGEHADVFTEAACNDFERLLEADDGIWPDLGDPIDPSEKGPLGPLWPDGPPGW